MRPSPRVRTTSARHYCYHLRPVLRSAPLLLVLVAGCGARSTFDTETICERPDGSPCDALDDAGSRADASRADDASTPKADGSESPDTGPVVVASVAPCLADGNIVYVNGAPDDPVHPGESTYVFPSDDLLKGCGGYASSPDQIGISCPAASGSGSSVFSFFFRNADGRALGVGVYEGALGSYANDGHEPDLSVQADGAYGHRCDSYPLGRRKGRRSALGARGGAARS